MATKRLWLVCVDGSENSNLAFEETMKLANRTLDELILLNVVGTGIADAIKAQKSSEEKSEARFQKLY
jgi:hypothetical protein